MELKEKYVDIIYKTIRTNLLTDKNSKRWFSICYAEVSWYINDIPKFGTFYMAYLYAISELIDENLLDFETMFEKSFC